MTLLEPKANEGDTWAETCSEVQASGSKPSGCATAPGNLPGSQFQELGKQDVKPDNPGTFFHL